MITRLASNRSTRLAGTPGVYGASAIVSDNAASLTWCEHEKGRQQNRLSTATRTRACAIPDNRATHRAVALLVLVNEADREQSDRAAASAFFSRSEELKDILLDPFVAFSSLYRPRFVSLCQCCSRFSSTAVTSAAPARAHVNANAPGLQSNPGRAGRERIPRRFRNYIPGRDRNRSFDRATDRRNFTPSISIAVCDGVPRKMPLRNSIPPAFCGLAHRFVR